MANILFTTLSLTSGWNENIYHKDGQYCVCVQQQEQGAKYFLSTQKIDKIVIFGTRQTLEGYTVEKKDGKTDGKTEIVQSNQEFKAFDSDLPGKWAIKDYQGKETQLSTFAKLMTRLAAFLGNSESDNQSEILTTIQAKRATLKKENDKVKSELANLMPIREEETDPANAQEIENLQKKIQAKEEEIETIERLDRQIRENTLSVLNSVQESQNREIPVLFVPDLDENDVDNIDGLMKALTGKEDDPYCVYMDTQGGARTKIYVNNAVLHMLTESDGVYHTSLAQAIATNFTQSRSVHEIVDETNQYRIIELVSGMTAFLKYGHADVISHYLESISQKNRKEKTPVDENEKTPVDENEKTPVDENVKALVDAMQEIDLAIKYSRLDSPQEDSPADEVDLVSAVEHLKTAIQNLKCKKGDYSSSVRKIFDILTDAITDDYGDLLKENNSVNVISLMEWLIKKNNLYVASSVAESKLPSLSVRSGLLYYAKNKEDIERAEQTFSFYLACSDRQRYLFKDIHHFFIKSYIAGCAYSFQWESKELEKKKENNEPVLPPYEKARNITYCLDHPANYPIPIYSNYKDDIGKILVLYFYIAQNRNCLAHADNQSAVCAQDVMQAMEELMDLLKAKEEKEGGFCADKASVWKWYQNVQDDNHQITQDTKIELWRHCLRNEIFSSEGTPLGMPQYTFINNKNNPPRYLSEYYALGSLMYSMKMLKEKWTAVFAARTALLKNKSFKPFLLLWLKYYNESGDRDPQLPEYDKLMELFFPGDNSAAAVFNDTEDNRKLFNALWGSIESTSKSYFDKKLQKMTTWPNWENLFKHYLDSDDDHLRFLVEKIKSAKFNTSL